MQFFNSALLTGKKIGIVVCIITTSLKIKNFVLLCVLAISGFSASYAQNDACHKSTEGTDFWLGFMENIGNDPDRYLEITVTARESTTFNITFGLDENPYNGEYFVSANNSIQIKIPWILFETSGSEDIQGKGIHLTSEKPVNVYALNWRTASSDVALIYPVESLGKEYFAMCYYPDQLEGEDRSNSQFLVVATEDSTEVKITPSKFTDKLRAKDSTFVVTINRGEVYQVQSENASAENDPRQGDLTGSYISANKPVAFFSGAQSTRIPSGTSYWDHLFEQIPPIHSWGREYYTVPLKSREQDRYRIMAARDNTTVYISGEESFFLNNGEFKEVVFYHNEPKRILSDKPILVAQYSQSRDVDRQFTGGNGDPFMIILSSTTQAKNDVTFVAYDSNLIIRYFVNIISLTSEVDNIRFNGNSISSEFKKFPDGKYSYVQKVISAGNYRINNIDPDRGFLAYVYGFGGLESYGYGVGFNLDLVLDLGESIDFNGDTLLLCHGESVQLDAGPYFDTYDWNTEDTTQTLDIISGGNYHVRTTTIDGCNLEDSIYVYMSHPKTELEINYDEGCEPYSIEVRAEDGFNKYLWQNENNDSLSTNQTIVADKTGEYRLTVFNEYNCPARDTLDFVVFPVPKIKIDGDKLVCGNRQSSLSVDITDAPESVWNYPGSFSWSSNSSLVTINNQSHQNASVEVTDWGEYEIYYELNTSDGCTTTDTFKIQFRPVPTSVFEFVENPDDKCKGYSREVLYIGNATNNANFYWDFGGSKLIDSLDWNNLVVSIGAYNTNPDISLFVEENGCWSDTTKKPLGANPDFVLETKNARGCDSMTVLFKGKLGIEDALLFEWDFGDGSPVNNEREVEHFYSTTGFYDVSLFITNTINQCQIGFEIDSMIKVFPTPTAEITADLSFCYPDSAQISYTHFIDSSICIWDFEGAHQSGDGNETITMILDEPSAKAILTVDEYGCKSPPAEISLKRLPHFDFITENTEGCQPYSPEIFAESVDNYLDFTWLTHDSLPNPSGDSNIFVLPDSGKVDIGLVATSNETGCTDTLLKQDWIWIHPKPEAAFEVDYPVALLEQADITYTNLTEYADNFYWEFGDGDFSHEINPKHSFTALGDYNSMLYVESEYGCLDTAILGIKILPFSSFTPNAFRPNSEIPENRTFMPVGVGADLSRFNLKIYDRWGQMVFETNTPDNPWNGNSKNGNLAPIGNYIWISDYYDIQGFKHNQKGQILLVR